MYKNELLFNRQEILQKAKNKYCKEKATEYYFKNSSKISKIKRKRKIKVK